MCGVCGSLEPWECSWWTSSAREASWRTCNDECRYEVAWQLSAGKQRVAPRAVCCVCLSNHKKLETFPPRNPGPLPPLFSHCRRRAGPFALSRSCTEACLSPSSSRHTMALAPLGTQVRPYRDYLTPALHRRFNQASIYTLVLCYVIAVWQGGRVNSCKSSPSEPGSV